MGLGPFTPHNSKTVRSLKEAPKRAWLCWGTEASLCSRKHQRKPGCVGAPKQAWLCWAHRRGVQVCTRTAYVWLAADAHVSERRQEFVQARG